MKKFHIAILTTLIIVALGLGYLFFILPDQIEKNFIAKVPDSVKLDYEKFSLDYIKQGVVLSNVEIKTNDFNGIITANTINLHDLGDENIGFSIKLLNIDSDATGLKYQAKQFDVGSLSLPGLLFISNEFKKDYISGLQALKNAKSKTVKMMEINDSRLNVDGKKINFLNFTLVEFGNGMIKDFSLDSFSFIEDSREIKIGVLSIGSLPIPDPLKMQNDPLSLLVGNEIGPVKIMNVEGIGFIDEGIDAKISQITLTKPKIVLSNTKIPYIADIKLDVQKVDFPLQVIPLGVRRVLQEYIEGDSLSVNFALSIQANHSEKTFSPEITLGEEKNADLSLGVSLQNIPDEFFDLAKASYVDRDQILGKIQNSVKLGEATISYNEKGLVNKLINIQAKKTGQPVNKFKDQMIVGAESESLQSNSEKYKMNIAQLIEFIKQPRNINIKAKPDPPLKISELVRLAIMDRELLNKSIDLNVIANK